MSKAEHGHCDAVAPAAGRRGGFTVFELLVVIAIIAVLCGIGIVAYVKALQAARRAWVIVDMKVLVNAITAYHVEYGVWPGQVQTAEDRTYKDGTGGSQLQGNLFIALGTRVSPTLNSQGIVFIPPSHNGKLCPVSGCWFDPWGEHYIIALDENGDGKTELRYGSFSATVEGSSVLVMTMNAPGYLCSWRD